MIICMEIYSNIQLVFNLHLVRVLLTVTYLIKSSSHLEALKTFFVYLIQKSHQLDSEVDKYATKMMLPVCLKDGIHISRGRFKNYIFTISSCHSIKLFFSFKCKYLYTNIFRNIYKVYACMFYLAIVVKYHVSLLICNLRMNSSVGKVIDLFLYIVNCKNVSQVMFRIIITEPKDIM